MSNELKIAIEAAKIGAKKALEYYNKNLETKRKEDNSVVSIADTNTEEAIKSYISSQLPDAQFLAEESGGNINKETLWIIDPIDGTRSFLRGIDTWCVLIAYYEKNETKIGVCYFPLLNILLYAEKGQGTYCNDQKVYVSRINNLRVSFLGYGGIRHFENKVTLYNLIDQFESARSPEATYCQYLVAAGKMEAFVDAYAKPWDALPFVPIIQESGGRITNWKGNPLTFNDKGSITTNGLIHDEVIRILNEKK